MMLAALVSGCGKDGKKEYIICSDSEFPPFEYYDKETKTYVGADLDILDAIAKDQGFTYALEHKGFTDSMNAVLSGQADGMIAGMFITDTRKKTFDFSDGYYTTGPILIVREGSGISELKDLAGGTVACLMGAAGTEYAEANMSQYGYSIEYYADSAAVYDAVIGGANDAFLEDFAVAAYLIKTEGRGLVTAGEIINPKPYGFAVKRGTNKELLEMFNAGLSNIIASGQYDEILTRYDIQQ
jgi:polar amino acid transport system substrate-binding protein